MIGQKGRGKGVNGNGWIRENTFPIFIHRAADMRHGHSLRRYKIEGLEIAEEDGMEGKIVHAIGSAFSHPKKETC